MRKQKSPKILSSKAWLILFCLTAAVLVLVIWPLSNLLIDPFGAFGDPIFKWWSYDETMNPRVAKMSYLEENHEKYDSYILGCSSTSSLPVETFNEALDANFYNMIVYGADMLDTEQFARYLIENYEVKNIVLNIYMNNASEYAVGEDTMENSMPWYVSGSSRTEYLLRYLFAKPQYAAEKLRCYVGDSYIQDVHDVFNEDTGAYDKSKRDAEGIGSTEDYIALPAYSVFADYPHYDLTASQVENTAASVAAIRELCEANGVNFIAVACPVYHEALNWWEREDVEAFYTAIAGATDFWDFSLSSVSYEPRYFYDSTHFRNSVGEMICARIFGDGSVYMPEDFGHLLTEENVSGYFDSYWEATPLSDSSFTAEVPILLYHHIVEEYEGNPSTVSAEAFERQMAALAEAGYTAIGFEELSDYVEKGIELPEKPIVITFDDGYESNYSYALPILEKYGLSATVFTIGVSVGKDTYKDTGEAMTPHFSWEQAAEMEAGGVITVESHGYDIHQVEGRDTSPIREGILRKTGESEEEYIAFVLSDHEKMKELFTENLGKSPSVLAYPYGFHDTLSDILLSELGIRATVTIDEKSNTIIKGLPQSLFNLGRFCAHEDTDVPALISGQ